MAHVTSSVNTRLPTRRYSRPYEITLSDDVTDRNLQRNGLPYFFLQNVGAGGKVMIAWEPSGDLVDIYLAQGAVIEGGHWMHAMTTDTGGGVDLRGFVGFVGTGIS